MNIDILNAYCGIGFHRCHACLRVVLLAIAPVASSRHGSGTRAPWVGRSCLGGSVPLSTDRSPWCGSCANSEGGGSSSLPARARRLFHSRGRLRLWLGGRTVARLFLLASDPSVVTRPVFCAPLFGFNEKGSPTELVTQCRPSAFIYNLVDLRSDEITR